MKNVRMTPEETLRYVEQQVSNMELAKTMVVKVGLPEGGSATSKAYTDDGDAAAPTVLQVGIWHEYGTKTVPQRSFIRGPLDAKKAELSQAIEAQFELVLSNSTSVEKALGRVGLVARNISIGAFRTQGYGEWPALSPLTIELRRAGGAKSGKDVGNAAKASQSAFWKPAGSKEAKPLIDTGLLRSSITWVVE